MSNCDNPNIIQPGSEPPINPKKPGGGRGRKKVLPTGDKVVTPTTTTKGTSRTFSNPVKPGSSGATTSQGAGGGGGTPGTGSGSGGGGGAGGGGGGSAEKQWTQPKTEHGRKKGKKIKEEDGCKGQEKKSKEFKPRSIYPFNKVTQTESGHVFEIDDTPGSERISLFHRSGSNIEYYPNGDVVKQDVRDSYFHVFRDQYVHLGGYSTVTVDKGLKILVNSDEDENTKEENVNFDIHVEKNANINIYIKKGHMNVSIVEGDVNMRLEKGDINIRQDEGNFNHTVNGDYNLEVGGHMHVVVGGDVVNEIGGNRDERIDGEFDQKYLTNSSGYLSEYLKGDKRVFVQKNQILEVKETSSEKATTKTQNYQHYTTDVEYASSLKTGGDLNISTETKLVLQSKGTFTIKSDKSMDIFSCVSEKQGDKLRIFSGSTSEYITEKACVLRSATDKIELKAPENIKIMTQILYKPEMEDGPKFQKDPKPVNKEDPYSNKLPIAELNDSFLKNNKKQWIPTNSKK
jgi:hypothetical protein